MRFKFESNFPYYAMCVFLNFLDQQGLVVYKINPEIYIKNSTPNPASLSICIKDSTFHKTYSDD